MLSVLNVIIYAMIVLISIILVVLILIQPSKGGGLGSAFGGVGENVFGAHAMEHLSKLTVWLISIFFVLTLALTVLSAHAKNSDKSVMAGAPVPVKAEAVVPAGETKAVKEAAPVKAEAAKSATPVKAEAAKAAAPVKADKDGKK